MQRRPLQDRLFLFIYYMLALFVLFLWFYCLFLCFSLAAILDIHFDRIPMVCCNFFYNPLSSGH